jgi:hypothetical protein
MASSITSPRELVRIYLTRLTDLYETRYKKSHYTRTDVCELNPLKPSGYYMYHLL